MRKLHFVFDTIILICAVLVVVIWMVHLIKLWLGIPYSINSFSLASLYVFAILGMIGFIMPNLRDFLGEISAIKNRKKTYRKE
jgi:hypothetical protein